MLSTFTDRQRLLLRPPSSRASRKSCIAGCWNYAADDLSIGLYTDESPGLKVDPVVVLVLSLGFIFSVVALHSRQLLNEPRAWCIPLTSHSHCQDHPKVLFLDGSVESRKKRSLHQAANMDQPLLYRSSQSSALSEVLPRGGLEVSGSVSSSGLRCNCTHSGLCTIALRRNTFDQTPVQESSCEVGQGNVRTRWKPRPSHAPASQFQHVQLQLVDQVTPLPTATVMHVDHAR